MLRCPVCSRNGFQRLGHHLSRVHGIKKAESRERWPGISLEVEKPGRELPCSECGELARVKGRAGHAKCDRCRKRDDREKVACKLCGVERRRLGAHLKSTHGLTAADYRAQFPEALLEVPETRKRSAECRAKQAAAAKRRWEDLDERKAQSDRLKEAAPWRGRSLPEEHRAAISKACLGLSPNLSDEERARRGRQGRKALAKIRQQPGYRKKLSEGQKRRVLRGEKVGFQVPGTMEKAYETRLKNGTLSPPDSGRGIGGFRKGQDHYTRSTTEANFARVLIDAGVDYQYEPRCFRLEIGRRVRRYTPDFYLREPLTLGGKVLVPAGWLEIKGWRHKDGSLPAGAQEKLDALRALVDEAVSVLTGSDPEWEVLRDHWQPRVDWEVPGYDLRSHPGVFSK
jgi:hypothetical protein